MPQRAFTRGQTQILYRFLPSAIFEHDDYGLCKVEEVITDDVDRVNKSALFATLIDALGQWEREEFRRKFPDPRIDRNRNIYKIGQPREIRFNPFPLVLQCRRCGHVVDLDRLQRRGLTPGKCPRTGCDGDLQQMPYVEAHNCGRIEQIYVPPPSRGCLEHKTQHLRFFDPGRTQAARWVCGICGQELQKTRMTPCQCEFTNAIPALGRSPFERFLRVYPTSEPGLYVPHVVAFINFPEEQERRLTQVDDALPLLLARVWGILEQKVLQLAEERRRWSPGGESLPAEILEIVKMFAAQNPEHPYVKQYAERIKDPPGQREIERVRQLLGAGAPLSDPPGRKLVEHVALLDTMSLTSVETVARRLKERDGEELSARFREEAERALRQLGLGSVHVVNDFPIALTALGFTRVTREPSRSVFNPFPAGDDGKIPLFVVPTETEGLRFELDPTRVTAWLCENRFATCPVPNAPDEAWAWLYRNALRSMVNYTNALSPLSQVVQMLVHTMSHIFLQSIEWSGFAPSSVGEYLMPGTLSFVLYANRFAESKIGGLTTLFEQRLPLWLRDAAQSGRSCMYDPLCSEEGGSCAGCLHREHNCPLFNREMSRSVLYGGFLPTEGVSGLRQIFRGYWDQAWEDVG